MKITFSGHSKSMSREELREATDYFIRIILRDKSKKIKKISVTLVDKIKDPGYEGTFGCLSKYQCDNTLFFIQLDGSQTKRTILKSLAHEIKHIDQYVAGKLVEIPYYKQKKLGGDVIWMGKVYNENLKGKMYKRQVEYLKAPWEKDAFKCEVSAYNRWLKFKLRR